MHYLQQRLSVNVAKSQYVKYLHDVTYCFVSAVFVTKMHEFRSKNLFSDKLLLVNANVRVKYHRLNDPQDFGPQHNFFIQ